MRRKSLAMLGILICEGLNVQLCKYTNGSQKDPNYIKGDSNEENVSLWEKFWTAYKMATPPIKLISQKANAYTIIMWIIQLFWVCIDYVQDVKISKGNAMNRGLNISWILSQCSCPRFYFGLVFVFRKNKECNCLPYWESGKKESGHKNNTLCTTVPKNSATMHRKEDKNWKCSEIVDPSKIMGPSPLFSKT